MAKAKRYYWLKLKEDFFQDEVIAWIEEQEKGIYYTNFYLKLCLKAMNSEGLLIRRIGDMLIPYDIKNLAKITGVDQDTVIVAMELLKKTGLVEILDNGEIYLTQLQNMIGSESGWAEKKRLQREKKKSGDNVPKLEDNVQNKSGQSPTDIDIDIDIDIDKDNKVYIQENKVGEYVSENLSYMSKLYQQNIGIANGIVAEWLIEISEKIDVALFRRALEICTERGNTTLGYLKGIIKKWLNNNITTLEQLKSYELQNKKYSTNSVSQNQENIQNNDKYLNEEDDPEFQRLLEESNKQLEELNKRTWGDN